MASTIRSSMAYAAFLFVCLLVLVSSFSTRLPSSASSPNFRNVCPQESQAGVAYRHGSCESPFALMMSSSQATTVVETLFSKYCDEDSLIDKKTIESMPPFAGMLADEDLEQEELDEIWEAASKSPDDSSRVDVVSFVKIYNDVDDLFEDDGDDEEEEDVETPVAETDDNELDEELSKAYKFICDENGLVSKDSMMKWEEIESLFEEGLLGEDEFEELWDNAVDSEKGSLDAGGFLKFNNGLDDLFVIDDDDEDDGDDDDVEPPQPPATAAAPRAMVVEGDNPPGVLFSQLADQDYLVGMKELNLWMELKELLDDGELEESELQQMFDKVAKSGKLDEESFLQLYDDIETLFEEIDDDEDGPEETATAPPQQQQQQQRSPQMSSRVKDDLLGFVDIIVEEDEELCGFGAEEADQEQVMNIVKVLEQQPSNLILQKEGNIERTDLTGKWQLLYTSSSSMKFNQGLSGIGGSFPNGKFGGFTQELKATKFLSDFEYKERVDVTPASASFDVTVNGIWDLRKSVSLFTGQPTVILNVEPDRVKYGVTSTRADHWKSLGPTNRLDLSYLDDDLRVMRGCTSSDTIFIFKKVQ